MRPEPVIAIFDVGKTNKKLFLFNKDYKIVYERSARFTETVDEDGDPCENLESLRLSVFDSLRDVFSKKEFEVKAVNFSAYGASFVYIDENGTPLCPLYNYLKSYPKDLKERFYDSYGPEGALSKVTASPLLDSLNSGMQLYRIKHEKAEVFQKVKYALHLPQYLSFLLSGKPSSDITSIGCHTLLWDFTKNDYHEWVRKEGIDAILAPLLPYNAAMPSVFPGSNLMVGGGLHDSSAALLPYLLNFQEPFVLISSGTWCISLNPFNQQPLTTEELASDCLCYLQYTGEPVKASRLFAGAEHEEQVKRIAGHFGVNTSFYRGMPFQLEIAGDLQEPGNEKPFGQRNLAIFASPEQAYHQLMMDIIRAQVASTNLVLNGGAVKRIFVDGGFSRNAIFMNLLAAAYPRLEVFAASMPEASALGAALALHSSWNGEALPADMIQLQYYGGLLPATI